MQMQLGGMEWIDGMVEGREIDGRYVICAALAAGASATVYRGVVKVDGTPIAIKIIDRLDVEVPHDDSSSKLLLASTS